MASPLVRDRLTWTAYLMIAWFACLQAAPGVVTTHLRDELHLSYGVGGSYVAAFAAGSVIAGVASTSLERAAGRSVVLWSAAVTLSVGAVGMTAGRTAATTIAPVFVMGVGGGLLLAVVQAALADHHHDLRTVALTEANVAAGVAYMVLIGLLTAAAAWGLGWRAAVLVTLVVPVVARWNTRGLAIEESPPSVEGHGPRLPRAFWVVAAILVCTTAVEWSVTAWGATFVEEATSVSSDTAVTLMAAYFGGFLGGRVLGSRLARRTVPESLLAWAVGLAFIGFVVLWTSTSPAQAALGLAILGVGVGNLFPMTLSAAVAAAPGRAGQASGRAVATSSAAVLLAPLAIGTIADSTSLKAALCVVPALLALAAAGLVLLRRVRSRSAATVATVAPAEDGWPR